MKIHRIKAVMRRHLYDIRHNIDRSMDVFYWPIIDVIVWGFFSFYISTNNTFGPSIINFLMGAIILWSIFYAFQRDFAVGFLEELWSRNLLNIFSTPITMWEYLTGVASISIFKIIIGSFTASLCALIFYSFNIFPHILLLIPYVLNLLFFAAAIGICITALILRYTTKVQILAWSFAGLLQPVSCVFYPLSSLPQWLQSIAWFLPTAHAFEGMRQVLTDSTFSSTYFWWALILNIFYFPISLVIFKKTFEATKIRGLLVKLT
ncbi:MAG: hypothetical protein A2V81_05190 [Candidatus Abawacabacteria bacterium RBG_16_42_10]|uniref:Transport permease protein n=1 Tax=Candidatus Abawacabacteria bacterium RBG_16_42_10 TaxID=1817814 RepID=A0A1F4XJ58_9BACT|nr:MAG: hypothetical protein A2V81_05190 [Candidatus Abawacabacteria bacterium RBG_16_42_10]